MAKSKYAIDPNKPYSGLAGMAEKASNATKEANDYGYLASVLPSVLKEKFREAGDPKLDAAISTKTQQVMGGAIEGLNKYQDISNPFTRRALAEKYQGGLSIGLDSLTSERDRRQGKFEEYITKWSGLYGAEAARKQANASLAQGEFNTYKGMADTAENTRRYNIEQGQQAASRGKDSSSKYQSRLNSIEDDVRTGKYSRETAREKLRMEFPDKDPEVIYKVVEDNYEKTPYSSKYFSPKAEDIETGSERNATNTADIRDYYSYLLSVDEGQAKKYKKQYEWAF